jgi:nucleoside-diphosphate-sugar epimerase
VNLLLTGSTGFVGRNLLLHVLRDPLFSTITLPVRNKQRLLQQLSKEGIERLPSHLSLCSVENNCWDLEALPEPDLVIHAAGLTFSRTREPYFETHLNGTLQLLKLLPTTSRIIVLSSVAAAGPTPEGHMLRHDDDPVAPVSWYGESKLKMEQELLKQYSQRLLLLRPPIVLGPRDTATLPLFKMARGPLRIKPGRALKHYSWIDVDDLCQAILRAAQSNWTTAHPYFVTSEETITDLELIETTAAILQARGITLRIPHGIIQLISSIADRIPALHQPLQSLGPDRVKEILPSRWVVDGAPFRRDFQWRAQRGLCETLTETARWLDEQRS